MALSVSMTFQLRSSCKLCRTYKSIGIFTFKQDETSIQVPVMPDTLQVSPAGDRTTVVVVSLNRRYLFVSRDFGRTWNRYKTPTQNFNPTDELYLSGRNPQHMVIRSRSGEVHSTHAVLLALNSHVYSCGYQIVEATNGIS